jgi:hypothetical protein
MTKKMGKIRGIDGSEAKEPLIAYKYEEHQASIEVYLDEETVWLSLNQMALLFDRDKSVISRHISKIYEEKELDRTSTVFKVPCFSMKINN